ncbi:MAG: GAF and ANTAR domain-containing protein [Actinobacteria bacterium]|nr:GAF and ANTAR domain-containing protein [Actinomycetota bacterium]
MTREGEVSAAFVDLVDQLVGEFDVIDLLTVLVSRCVALLEAAAAGILLADHHGQLRVMAASTEEIRMLEVFQVQNEQGPCHDCYSTGQPITVADLDADHRWPEFASMSLGVGYPSVSALPMRLRNRMLGCLNLFMATRTALAPADVALAQAPGDVASIAIVQGQLERALDSRVAIEQAKGMVAQSTGGDMDSAFALIRSHARSNNLQLTDVCRRLTEGTLEVTALASRTHHS